MNYSYATLNELKTYLNISVYDDDMLLLRLLEAATQTIDSLTQRRFTAFEETRIVTSVHQQYVFLNDDIVQLLEVTDRNNNVIDVNTIDIPVYPTRYLKRLNATFPRDGVKVKAQWGFSFAPPHDIKQVCIRLAAYLYRQKDAQVFDVLGQAATGTLTLPAGIPSDVRQMLDNYRVRSVAL